jgi:SAM-dependent methyltransferase
VPRRPVTEPQFPSQNFLREDEEDDRAFYAYPRKVVHIDDGAIDTVGRLFRDFIPAGATVLDLMSSWRSHWPSGHSRQRLVGLGLNAEEMADNPDLDEYVVHNVNEDPVLPFADGAFDAVVITVSVQYLTRPIETFRQVNRILRAGGQFIVSFSNRMFPTKAVNIWRNSNDRSHLELVASYLDYAGGFEDVKGGLANPQESPPGDPLFVVMGKKALSPTGPAQDQ